MSSSRSDHSKDQEYVFKLIKHIQYAMLTTADDDGNLCSRPMTYKQGDSDSKTELCDPSHQTYVSISSHAELVQDKAKAKELGQSYLKAWFPQELDDPNLGLLKVTIEGAEYWDSASSLMVRAVGYVKAALGNPSTLEDENKKVDFS
ncbi:unnamed protein product [Rotaria sp. Silwood1]|nr:unnamed protein product [Rotaria sp. Silwood1]CAF4993612.1 unnamed protein product [Rotaria sp. Silwood1]